ncbi:hypothetical protein [Niallia nealsonii]|uniref:Uncharacterized protein n=1 Tax=Niallia nealsonii TaxID=115979 RepID=A0A2N0YWU7_9BACI|nr:hypothetical protein [Niallia nealsonii]PKG21737.1 hypothetical protein CWS01_20790 [Niallia nealsonii]
MLNSEGKNQVCNNETRNKNARQWTKHYLEKRKKNGTSDMPSDMVCKQELCHQSPNQEGGNPEQNQTIGDQEQLLEGVEQTQSIGNQQITQEGGEQSQSISDTQQNHTLGNVQQTFGNTEQNLGNQEVTQNQSHGNQTQTLGDQNIGDQNVSGHTNNSPLNNNQTIDTRVSGITINLSPSCNSCNKKCDDSCNKKRGMEHCEECCRQSLCALLKQIQALQNTTPDNGVNIELSFQTTPNPVENQVITNINNCRTVTFMEEGQTENFPSTTVLFNQLNGISVSSASNELFALVNQLAATCNILPSYSCECTWSKDFVCDSTIASDLASAARFGVPVQLLLEGQTSPTDLLNVLNVCDCLIFLADDLTTPTTIYVYTACAINGFITA